MNMDVAGKIAALVGVPIALIAILISYLDLRDSIAAVEAQMDQERAAISMQAASSYLNSPELQAAKKLINSRTANGTDYSGISKDDELYNSIVVVLNHLETTATGIDVGVYDDAVICRSLKQVIAKLVEVHIEGQRPTGVTKPNSEPFAASEFPNLVAAYSRWSSQPHGCAPINNPTSY